MLAQSFMPAAELNITEPQKDALIKTLVLMETGKLVHAENEFDNENEYEDCSKKKFTGHFNMATWYNVVTCGTICCIAGTAEIVGKVDFDGWTRNYQLSELFAPDAIRMGKWSKITVSQAATALRSYLTTGSPNWAATMEVA